MSIRGSTHSLLGSLGRPDRLMHHDEGCRLVKSCISLDTFFLWTTHFTIPAAWTSVRFHHSSTHRVALELLVEDLKTCAFALINTSRTGSGMQIYMVLLSWYHSWGLSLHDGMRWRPTRLTSVHPTSAIHCQPSYELGTQR